MPIGT